MRGFATELRMLVAALALTGCAGGPRPADPAPLAAQAPPEPGREVLWVRDSAEYEAALVQTYRLAAEQLEELTRDLEPHGWAVILDADETVISNLGYSLRRALEGGYWTDESWHEWTQAREASALPGAREFIDTVHRLGGRVAIVTNRRERDCPATRDNLQREDIRFDILMCNNGDATKDARWEAVRTGAGTGLGPLEVVMWIGDNILDFPGLDQSARERSREAFSEFGVRYFVLPNPLYGSWDRE